MNTIFTDQENEHWAFFAELAAESPDMARAVVRGLRRMHELSSETTRCPASSGRYFVESEAGQACKRAQEVK